MSFGDSPCDKNAFLTNPEWCQSPPRAELGAEALRFGDTGRGEGLEEKYYGC